MKLATKTEPNKWKLDTLESIGWKNLEIYTNYDIIENPGTLSLLHDYDFSYAVHAPTDYFDMTVVDFARNIGAEIINTHKIIENDVLASLVAYAKKFDIRVTVENEAFPTSHHLDKEGNQFAPVERYDPICSNGDWRRLQEEIPDVRLCIDVEHAIIRREWPDFIDCADDLGHLHICGYTGGAHHRPVYENIELAQQTAMYLNYCSPYQGFVVCEHDIEFHTEEVWTKTLEMCTPIFED